MIRSGAWLAIGLLAAACGAPLASTTTEPSFAAVATLAPSGSATASATPATHAPTLEPEPSATPAHPDPTAAPTGPTTCPTKEPITVAEFLETDKNCFGSDDIVIHAWLDTPPIFGFIGPIVRPTWLYYPPDGSTFFTLFDEPPSDPDVCGGCMFVHIAPDSTIVLEGPARWVIATGHRRDPAWRRCHYDEPDDWTGPERDDEGAREGCRDNFVLDALADAPPP
jgi:hypothetical protein